MKPGNAVSGRNSAISRFHEISQFYANKLNFARLYLTTRSLLEAKSCTIRTVMTWNNFEIMHGPDQFGGSTTNFAKCNIFMHEKYEKVPALTSQDLPRRMQYCSREQLDLWKAVSTSHVNILNCKERPAQYELHTTRCTHTRTYGTPRGDSRRNL